MVTESQYSGNKKKTGTNLTTLALICTRSSQLSDKTDEEEDDRERGGWSPKTSERILHTSWLVMLFPVVSWMYVLITAGGNACWSSKRIFVFSFWVSCFRTRSRSTDNSTLWLCFSLQLVTRIPSAFPTTKNRAGQPTPFFLPKKTRKINAVHMEWTYEERRNPMDFEWRRGVFKWHVYRIMEYRIAGKEWHLLLERTVNRVFVTCDKQLIKYNLQMLTLWNRSSWARKSRSDGNVWDVSISLNSTVWSAIVG